MAFLNFTHGHPSGPIPVKVGSRVIVFMWYNSGMDMLEAILRWLRLPLIAGGVEFNAHNEVKSGVPIIFELKPLGKDAGKPIEAIMPLIFHTAGRDFGEPMVELVVKSPPNINIEELLGWVKN